VDGPGIRYTIFVQGCPHHCPGCHNPETHDFEGGHLEDTEDLIKKIKQKGFISGITISGGEPFSQAFPCALLAEAAHDMGKSVMVYSGYTFEQLLDMAESDSGVKQLLCSCDILVDGPYLESSRNIDLPFRGSENQRVLDMSASLDKGQAVEMAVGREVYGSPRFK